jgi:hypothetical protein
LQAGEQNAGFGFGFAGQMRTNQTKQEKKKIALTCMNSGVSDGADERT